MRHRSSYAYTLLAMLLGMAWALSHHENFSAPSLDDHALSLVRGADPNQNSAGDQSCDDIQGMGLSYAACVASGPFPSSSTCVLCDDKALTFVMDPNADPRVKLSQPLTNPNYTCAGNKFVGDCIGASPFQGGPPAQCNLPDQPTGNCAGNLQLYVQQITPPKPK